MMSSPSDGELNLDLTAGKVPAEILEEPMQDGEVLECIKTQVTILIDMFNDSTEKESSICVNKPDGVSEEQYGRVLRIFFQQMGMSKQGQELTENPTSAVFTVSKE